MLVNHGLIQLPITPRDQSSFRRSIRIKTKAIICLPYLKQVFAAPFSLWETLRSPRSAKLQGSTAYQLQREQRAWVCVSLARSQSLAISYVILLRPAYTTKPIININSSELYPAKSRTYSRPYSQQNSRTTYRTVDIHHR